MTEPVKLNASFFNLPKTSNAFINRFDLELHWRYSFPPPTITPKLILFWIHGFGGHVNGPVVKMCMDILTKHGCIIILIDLQGHGYSEGVRGLVYKHEDMINDIEDFIGHVRSWEKFSCSYCLKSDLSQHQMIQLQMLPYFIQGQSMGGGVATFLSLRLQQDDKYKGMILIAPSLLCKTPHPIIVWWAKLVMKFGCCYLEAEMPSWSTSVSDLTLSFKHQSTIDYVMLDKWGNEGGIGGGQSLKWATALMFLRMFEDSVSVLSSISSPFLILHDPDDKVCFISGSRSLMQLSVTPPEKKELKELPGYLHSLLYNYPEEVCEIVLEWMLKTLAV